MDRRDRAGIFATVASIAALCVIPGAPIEEINTSEIAILLAFTAGAVLISIGCESLRRGRRDAVRARRQIEEVQRKLRVSERIFKDLANSLPVLIWTCDDSRSCNWCNSVWLEFTGRSVEQELGFGWLEGVHPEDRERCLEAFESNFNQRRPFHIDYRLRHHGGSYRWIYHSARPTFSDDGGFCGYLGGCIDIHDRKEQEAKLAIILEAEQAARAASEHASMLKDEFLATVSHELRTPLTAILGWIVLLKQRRPETDLSQAIDVIERNARAQTRIIDDLLDMNRILSGRLHLDVQRVALPDVIQAALAAVQPGATAKRIAIAMDAEPCLPEVHGDPVRLQQIIWNLLSNAVKFTPAEGKITVSLKKTDSQIEVAVADSGSGIDPSFLPHVFDRFRQADSSSTRRQGGMGLGLSIAKNLAELHGGSLQARSEGLSKGSKFVLRLPAPSNTEDAQQLAASPSSRASEPLSVPRKPEAAFPSPSLANLDLLVVDDDADTRNILRSILESAGAQVTLAADAAEAIAAIDRKVPSAIISDIGMPGRDGYELLREIRSRQPCEGGNLPAIALTAFARSEDRRKALSAGFQVHLAKPVEPGELVRAVGKLPFSVEVAEHN